MESYLEKRIKLFHSSYKINRETECWEWTKSLSKDGYGQLQIPRYKFWYAHTFSYYLYNGLIPEGLCVCHECDNPKCANPEHLFIGTRADNTRDMVEKGRKAKVPKGEKHWKSKLTETEVLEIYNAPNTYSELAETYNVCPATVGFIKNGRNWAYLTKHNDHGC